MATINMLTISGILTVAALMGAPDELLQGLITLNLGNAAWILSK